MFAVCTVGAIAGEPAPPPVTPPVAIEPTPPKGEAAALPEVNWKADKQSFIEDKRAIVLSGSAWVRYKGTKLEADNIVFFQQTQEVYAEGNVRLRAGESELDAQAVYIDVNNDTGYLIDAVVRVSAPPDALQGLSPEKKEPSMDGGRTERITRNTAQVDPAVVRSRDPFGVYLDVVDDPLARTNLIFRAQKIVKHGRMLYSAEDAYITTDDLVHPMYGVKVGQLDFFMREVQEPNRPGRTDLKPHKIVVKRARLDILGVTLFPFPTVTYDMGRRNVFFQSHIGNSKRWGPFLLNRIGYNLGGGEDKLFDPTRVYLDLDERMKRGPGGGFQFDWQTGIRPPESAGDKGGFDRGMGHLRVYALDEIQTQRADDVRRARRDLERRIQPKIDGFPRREFDANLLFLKRRRLQDAGPPSFELDEHRDEWRGMVDFQHHQPLKRFAGIDNLQLDMVYERQTDRDFMLEYFQNNYMTQNQPEAMVSLRKPSDNYSFELLYRDNPQDFDGAPPRSPFDFGTFTSYRPGLTYSLVPTPLPYGFFLKSELQGARLERDFERAIYDLDSFESNRAYAVIDLSRPFRWSALNIVPHLGTQQQAYDNSRDGEGAFQGAVTYGLDVTSRIYGTFADFENDALGLQGMRHIIEPRLSYRGVSDTREDPEDLLDFDEIDDLQALDKVTLSLEQTFQTKRPTKDGTSVRTVDFAGFDMAVDFFPRNRDQERLLNGDSMGLLRLDGFLRVVDVVKVDGSLGFSTEDGEVEKAAYGITIDPQTRWRLRFEERFNFGDQSRAIVGSDQYRLKFEYQLSERWGFAYERISEARKSLLHRKGRQVERISLTRSYGPLDATFTYAFDKNLNESAFFASVRPAYAYRNLIVPSQDLLVATGEAAGDDLEAPEERNFDPFELLRKRKKAPPEPGRKGDTIPAPLPGRDPDVPIPPAPAPDKRAGGAASTADNSLFRDPNQSASADQFKDPRELDRRRPARRIDEDDWTTPPATPASTR